MVYKKLNSSGSKRIVCAFNASKKQIPLYDNIGTEDEPEFVCVAIGLY
jgi:hypothetical protein